MPNSVQEHDARIADLRITADTLEVELRDGRRLRAPLSEFPWLVAASSAARSNWTLGAGGYGVLWPDLEEEIGVLGLLRMASANG